MEWKKYDLFLEVFDVAITFREGLED